MYFNNFHLKIISYFKVKSFTFCIIITLNTGPEWACKTGVYLPEGYAWITPIVAAMVQEGHVGPDAQWTVLDGSATQKTRG